MIRNTTANRYIREKYYDMRPEVLDWERRVRINGGTVSAKTMYIVNKFYKRINAFDIAQKIKSCCVFVPDDKISAVTPLINPSSSNFMWCNVLDTDPLAGIPIPDQLGELDIDLNITGARIRPGNDSGDPLATFDSGIQPFTDCKLDSMGITLYSMSTPVLSSTSDYDAGCTDNNYPSYGNTNVLNITLNGKDQFPDHYTYFNTSMWNDNWQVEELNHSEIGYFSINRTSLTNLSLYYRGSPDYVHKLVSTYTTLQPTISLPRGTIRFNGRYEYYSAFSRQSSRWLSFAAVHEGLTGFESNILYDTIQRCRQELGGGYL